MTITSSGVKCDVHGGFILFEDCYPFKLKFIEQELHACKDCIAIVKKLDSNNGGNGDWKDLPNGPLRTLFEEHEKSGEHNE